jgi:glycosyltransferase involved in cell wall biosynthesis
MLNKKIKTILVDITSILPGGDNGGAKIFVITLLEEMIRLAPKITFILLIRQSMDDHLESLRASNVFKKIMVYDGDQPKTNFFTKVKKNIKVNTIFYFIAKIKNILKNKTMLNDILAADILFSPFSSMVYSSSKIPTVGIVYDLQYKAYPQFFNTQDLLHRDNMFKEACNKASALVSISNFTRNDVISNSEFSPSRIKTIYIETSSNYDRKVYKSEILLKLGITKKKYFLYPANFWEHKNHEMLILAFLHFVKSKKNNDIKLVFTGASSSRKDFLKSSCVEMNLDQDIIFLDYLNNNDFQIIFENCLGLFFPSLYEGFGMPVVEAFAKGIPVACSDILALQEIGHDSALFFNPYNLDSIVAALITMSTNIKIKEKLVKQGINRAEKFNKPTRMAGLYFEVFNQTFLDFKA